MKKILMLTAAVFALQAIPAMAEDGAPKEGKRHGMFEKLDTNGDGQVSEAEHLVHAKERFKAMDANGDGQVSKEEGRAHHEARKAEWKQKREEMKAKKEAATPAE